MRLVVFGIPEAVTKKLLKPAVCKISKKAQLDLLKDDDPMCESLLILTPGNTPNRNQPFHSICAMLAS